MTPPWESRFGAILYPLSFPYLLGVSFRNWLYRKGILRTHRLPIPVISIGGLTCGGSGKTPLVVALSSRFSEWGLKVATLFRGYKGRLESKGGIVSDGFRILLAPRDCGDEPYLVAKKTGGVLVAVGKDRYKVAQGLLRSFSPQVVLLDDGFQHLKLERDLDILALDVDLEVRRPRLLPSGPFREPLSSIKRSDCLVLTYWEGKREHEELYKSLKDYGKPIFRAFPFYKGLRGQGKTVSLSQFKGEKVAILLGIANPKRFIRTVEELGFKVVSVTLRPDHHFWSKEELSKILGKAGLIITTEKDLVKLEGLGLPVYALELELELEEGFWVFLKERLSRYNLSL